MPVLRLCKGMARNSVRTVDGELVELDETTGKIREPSRKKETIPIGSISRSIENHYPTM
jgi:hypothetical protein